MSSKLDDHMTNSRYLFANKFQLDRMTKPIQEQYFISYKFKLCILNDNIFLQQNKGRRITEENTSQDWFQTCSLS